MEKITIYQIRPERVPDTILIQSQRRVKIGQAVEIITNTNDYRKIADGLVAHIDPAGYIVRIDKRYG